MRPWALSVSLEEGKEPEMTTEERLAKVERELAATRKELADLRAELDNE